MSVDTNVLDVRPALNPDATRDRTLPGYRRPVVLADQRRRHALTRVWRMWVAVLAVLVGVHHLGGVAAATGSAGHRGHDGGSMGAMPMPVSAVDAAPAGGQAPAQHDAGCHGLGVVCAGPRSAAAQLAAPAVQLGEPPARITWPPVAATPRPAVVAPVDPHVRLGPRTERRGTVLLT